MEVAARAARGRGPLREGEEDDQGHDHQAHGGGGKRKRGRVVANFWQNFRENSENFAHFRLYRRRSLRENTRFAAFFGKSTRLSS